VTATRRWLKFPAGSAAAAWSLWALATPVGLTLLLVLDHRVGLFDAFCVVGFGHLVCQGVAEFPGKGDITVAGEFPAPPSHGGVSGTVAITGGTGRYRGAKGEHQVTPIDDTHARVVFLLHHNG
jgi:hypothetical protein